MTIPDGDQVLLRDDVISRRLQWEGVEEAIAPRERGVGHDEAPREPPRAPLHAAHREEDEADPRVAPGTPEVSVASPRQREKRRVDWTMNNEEQRPKRRRGWDAESSHNDDNN